MSFQKYIPSNGKLLIAEPFADDVYFKRSVVLLTEHNDLGSVGFILNKPVDLKINEAVNDFPYFESNLFLGGPVNRDQLFYIHTFPEKLPGSVEIAKGLFWGGQFDTIKMLIRDRVLTENDIRFFVGYAGWQPTQLDKELLNRSWIVTQANKDVIMTVNPEDMWGELLRSMGKEYALIANFPEDPGMN